jgi:hypothetical protein
MDKLAKQPSEKPSGHKSPPKSYPKDKGMYADSKNFKYPLNTEKHVRAALAYLSQPKNQKGYSDSEIKYMFSRIHKRCKDLGIKVSKKSSFNSLLVKLSQIANNLDEFDHKDEANVIDGTIAHLINVIKMKAESQPMETSDGEGWFAPSEQGAKDFAEDLMDILYEGGLA